MLALACNVALKSWMNNYHAHQICLKQKEKVNAAKRVTMSMVTFMIMKRTNRLHPPLRQHLSFIGPL